MYPDSSNMATMPKRIAIWGTKITTPAKPAQTPPIRKSVTIPLGKILSKKLAEADIAPSIKSIG